MKIALAGNPNAGKTTLFNAITGARQSVGNYPGVTVEKKEGKFTYKGKEITIVDLPGTYSLSAYSLEEVVARNYIVNEKPEVVINIVDASNLERNLYLTIQFLELGIPVCIALSMLDIAKNRGITIDIEKLSKELGILVVAIDGRAGKGIEGLFEACFKTIETKPKRQFFSYGDDIDTVLSAMALKIQKENFLSKFYFPEWVALKYLENDQAIISLGDKENINISNNLKQEVEKVASHIESTLNSYPEAIIADWRYGFINSIMKQGIIFRKNLYDKLYVSDKIDKIVTNRLLGPFIMIAILCLLYFFTFNYSQVPVGYLERFFALLSNKADLILADGLLKSLLISGIIDGVGGVLGFTPIIIFMFFGIAILEDSGYLARVAFMLDRVFKFFGLHGSSVMSYIISGGLSGGCAVPGVMATRVLRSKKERLATMLTAPFMNCGAKLPIMALLIAAFFNNNQTSYMILFTVISWLTALIVAKILRTTFISGESTPFVMELPPYRLPTLKGLLIHTWERTWQYVKKAGTVILLISIMIWAMMTFPRLPDSKVEEFNNKKIALEKTLKGEELEKGLKEIKNAENEAALIHSIAGRVGMFFEPISKFSGFDWKTNIALFGGIAAKEVIVSTLGTAYSMGEDVKEESLAKKLEKSPNWSYKNGLALIIFVMFYSPCFVTIICIAKESGSWKWAMFSVVFNTIFAFLLSVSIFQIFSRF